MSSAFKELYEFSNFRLNVAERFLLRGEERLAVPDKVFETLCVLVRRGGELVTKDDLMEEVWGDTIVEENNLDKKISALRKILGERGGGEKFIETVRGHGFRFVAEVQRVDEVESRELKVESDSESQISNLTFQTGNHNGDERNELITENQRPKTKDRIEDAKFEIRNPKSNVVALTAWRRDADDNNETITFDPTTATEIHEELQTNSVAVLPFKLIAAGGDEYLGIGMADALIVSLSKISDLQVRPTASVVPFAMSGANPIGAGRELKVEAILDGKLHQSGDNLRVNLQLIRVADGRLLWAEKFDGTASGIFRLEDEISAFVAQKLRRDLDENTLRLLTTRGTTSLAAYQAFLKARFHFHQGSPENYQKSDAFYAEAIRLDPNYAQAYAGLADVYILEAIFGLRRPPDAFAQAKEAVTKAVELEPNSAEVYAARANFNICFNRDLAEAGRSARKAVEVNPYSANAHNLLGQSLMFRGFYAEAEIALKQALEIDPLGFWHSCLLTICYFLWRKYDLAVAQSLTTNAINPKLYAETIKRCWSLTELGRHAEAFALYEKVSTQPGGESVIWFIGHAYAVTGESEKARAVLAQLKEIPAKMYISPYFFALIHAGLNETKEAIDYLEQTVGNRDPWMLFIYADPRLDNLRADSRFRALAKLVVPEAARADNEFLKANENGFAPTNFFAVAPNEKAETLLPPTAAEDLPPPTEIVLPVARAEIRRGWSANYTAGSLMVLTLLGGLILSAYRFFDFNQTNSQPSFERIKFRKVVGSDGGYSPTISPDGKTAAYRDGNSIIWLENLTTGSRIQQKDGDEPIKGTWLKFAPDGNYLYYVRTGDDAPDVTLRGIYRVAVPNGIPRKITGNTFTGATVSPDGKQIAFVRQEGGANIEYAMIVVNTDGTGERKIASHSPPNWFGLWGNHQAWSPDGTKIATIGGAPGYKHGDLPNVIVINIADGAEFFIPNPDWQTREFGELTWTADGNNLLVIAKDTTDSPFQIWQVSYPQGAWRRITNDLNNYSKVDVSADGETLITAQEKSYSHLWQMPFADTTRARQLTSGQTYKDGNAGLALTPDGDKIVYASSESGNYEIWSANIDGINRRQLTFGSGVATEPIVTPDNRYIIFIKRTNSTISHLWRMKIDGGNLTQLTHSDEGEVEGIAVTPDSRFVIYTALTEPPPRSSLFRIPIEGGEPVKLTDKFGSWMPVVSPDGKWIAYNFYDHEIAEMPWRTGIMPIAGGAPVKNIEQPLRGLVRWTTDSQSLLYLEKNWMNIWQMPIFTNGAPKQITDFKAGVIRKFTLSPDGRQLFLARGSTETNIVLIENAK